MKILVYDAPKTMRVDEAPDFPLGENDLRVQTLYSGMSQKSMIRKPGFFFRLKGNRPGLIR